MKLTVLASFAIGVIALDGALLFKVLKDDEFNRSVSYKKAYDEAYATYTSEYKQQLLDAGFAEYDRKTGVWYLLSATEVQGNLIEPAKRKTFVDLSTYEKFLQDELVSVQKRKSVVDKNKSPIDFKMPL